MRRNEREFARIADRFEGLSELVRARGGDDAGRRRLRSALADMERVLEKHLARKPPGLFGRLTARAKSVALADGLKLELEVSRPLASPPPSPLPSHLSPPQKAEADLDHALMDTGLCDVTAQAARDEAMEEQDPAAPSEREAGRQPKRVEEVAGAPAAAMRTPKRSPSCSASCWRSPADLTAGGQGAQPDRADAASCALLDIDYLAAGRGAQVEGFKCTERRRTRGKVFSLRGVPRRPSGSALRSIESASQLRASSHPNVVTACGLCTGERGSCSSASAWRARRSARPGPLEADGRRVLSASSARSPSCTHATRPSSATSSPGTCSWARTATPRSGLRPRQVRGRPETAIGGTAKGTPMYMAPEVCRRRHGPAGACTRRRSSPASSARRAAHPGGAGLAKGAGHFQVMMAIAQGKRPPVPGCYGGELRALLERAAEGDAEERPR